MQELVLCGDIGGTNSSLSVVSISGNESTILFLEKYLTKSISSFPALVNDFISLAKKNGYEAGKACFSVAGPLRDGKYVKMTNGELCVDVEEIIGRTALDDALVINDFEAIMYGIKIVSYGDLIVLRGSGESDGTKAVVGAGTGLGTGFLYYDGKDYLPISSEGGHMNLPVEDEEDMKFADFVKKSLNKDSFPTAEDVVSGPGLELSYKYLQNNSDCPRDVPSVEISRTRDVNVCAKEAYGIFKKFYARMCRNIALLSFCNGGLYIAGGIASKNTDIFDDAFFKEFLNHDKFRHLLEKIPVFLITNYYISHHGAAYAVYCRDYYKGKYKGKG